MYTHRLRWKALVVLILAVLLLSCFPGSLLFDTRSTTVCAADSAFYDFIAQAPSASWSSAAGNLPFPGNESHSKGFALYRDNWQLEDNSTCPRALETHPQWVSNGWIMGAYPEMTVPSNAELKVTVGFFKGATASDGVTFEVKFEEFLGLHVAPRIYSLISRRATYDGKLDSITVALSSVEGKTGNFVLYANAGQNSGQDWAAWAEAKIEISSSDITPPQVTVTYSPSDVTTTSEVTFTARARDESLVTEIVLFIDGEQVKECVPPSQGVDEKDRVYWECIYTGGPYEAGELRYWAEAVDEYSNRGTSPEGTINVALVVTPCWFSISGTIHDFPYLDETLKIEVCEAETIMAQIDGNTIPITTCKEGGRVWCVDTDRLFSGDLPRPDLTYRVNRLCPGTYIVAPIYQPGAGLCEWQGSWQTAKGQVVTIVDSSAEGFDFTFEPQDSSAPRISSITADPEHPRLGEDVVITILTQDDGQIASIWEKTDTIHVDGSFHAGEWHSLTISPGMLGSTAGAQFSLTDDRIMQATVRGKVCDRGGNSHMAEMTVQFGSCDDEIQNQGETGIDCGGPCPSRCNNCLNDLTMGNGPSAYLYSPAQIDYVRGWALGALSEYANHWGINVFQLDTSDEYIEAIAWWVCTHMGYRGDNLNEQVLNDVAGLNYHPGDYGHGDFPEPAYYILNFSGQVRTDPSKWFFGDCEDFAILTSALLRSLGVSHQCIFNAEQPGHGFNIVNYHSKYRIFEPQSNVIGCEGYGPEFIWNDKIGAFASSDFEKVRPWQYTMNYPGCENPTVSVSGGGFGAKTLWLDWADWGEHTEVAVGDFDDDGKDDIAAVWYGGGYWPYQASVLFSTGSGFQIPSDYSRLARAVDFTPLVFRGRGSDYIVAPEGDELICVEGTPRTAPSFPGRVFTFYRPVTGMAVLGDPDGDGHAEVIELHKDAGEVYVNGDLWASGFSPGEEIPCIGDFDGDGYDDVVSFERGDWAGIRVIRAVPDEDKFTMLCLWNSEFCSGDEIPAVGDFNGDGRDDVIAFNLDNRDVFVGLSTVFGFWSNGFGSDPQARWHNDFCSDDDTPVVGDFNGDGLDDIACFRINNGRVRVWVALAMPTTLTYDYHGGNPCQQANFYLDAYWPSICP